MRAKNILKKIVTKKCENTFFIFTRIYDQKVGGKNERNNFSRNTRIEQAKNVGKKSHKSVEKRFLYSHEYREQKIGGKNLRNIFSETHE